jgi:hypothetical protein
MRNTAALLCALLGTGTAAAQTPSPTVGSRDARVAPAPSLEFLEFLGEADEAMKLPPDALDAAETPAKSAQRATPERKKP